jgi:hypothetical protein
VSRCLADSLVSAGDSGLRHRGGGDGGHRHGKSGPTAARAKQKPKVGTMIRHSRIISTLSLLAILAIAPAPASAGSLLSGYGAPGGGAQAIVGSALVNGPRGGGGPGASGSGSSSATGASGAASRGSTSTQGAAGGQATGQSASHGGALNKIQSTHGESHASPGRSEAPSGTSGGASPAYTASGAASAVHLGDSGALGFTGSDLRLVVLVLGILAVAAGFTRRMARMPH